MPTTEWKSVRKHRTRADAKRCLIPSHRRSRCTLWHKTRGGIGEPHGCRYRHERCPALAGVHFERNVGEYRREMPFSLEVYDKQLGGIQGAVERAVDEI